MRCLKKVAFALTALSFAAVSSGNDEPNSIGIFFDQAATQNEAWVEVPGNVTGYLILAAPTVVNIDAWWLGVDFTTTVHSYTLAGGGINRSTWSDPFSTSFYVELPSPLVCTEATILATFDIGVNQVTPTACVTIFQYIGDYGNWDDPGARSGGEYVYFWPSVGVPGYPIIFPACVAAINRDAPVAVGMETWSGVKALFE